MGKLKKVLAVTGGVLAVIAAILTQLGGTAPPRPSTVRPAPPRSVAALDLAKHCTPADYAMQCALANLPAPPVSGEQIAPALQGVDFAWGGPRSCAAMRSLGARFAVGYLSYDGSKNLGRGLADVFHQCGIATNAGWETTAGRATQGYGAGVSDAREANRQDVALGAAGRPIWFAVDFDAQWWQVKDYFRGVRDTLGLARTAAYGGYFLIKGLHDNGLVGAFNFQTYAWSQGLWLPASVAPLEQYNNNNPVFDRDRAVAADYGQSPAPPPPGPSPAQLKRWHDLGQAKNVAFRIYKHNHCREPQGKSPYCAIEAGVIKRAQSELWSTGGVRRFACFGPAARGHTKTIICWIVRPEASYDSQARDASRRALARCLQAGPVSFPTPCKHRGTFAQRVRYFDAKATALVKTYS